MKTQINNSDQSKRATSRLKLIQGLHLTPTEKKQIKTIIAGGVSSARFGLKTYNVQSLGNSMYQVIQQQKYRDDLNRSCERESNYVIQLY